MVVITERFQELKLGTVRITLIFSFTKLILDILPFHGNYRTGFSTQADGDGLNMKCPS
jgi:hypothetical protein